MDNALVNCPYLPEHCLLTAVYRLNVGPFFYIGSSTKIGTRRSYHLTALRDGIHTNAKLQDAWNRHQQADFTIIITAITRQEAREIEDVEIKKAFGSAHCCNLSNSAYCNSLASAQLKERWKDPEWRSRMVECLRKARVGLVVSEETRAKMAEAKTGVSNPRARACTINFKGEVFKFPTGVAAARHFGATQQAMDLWLKGHVSWPGSGRHQQRVKPQNAHLVGMSGSYDKLNQS